MMEANGVDKAAEACNAGPDQITGERYPYRQLEHENTIRLLFITPGSGEEITYTLLHAELGNIPYKALSYEWGLPSNDDPNITIDGHTVRIRKNLSEALKQISSVIRYLGFLFLWIDALCINQNDDAEKSQQVQKMGKIFSSAEQVFAWTGTMANDSDYAMDILNSAPPVPTLGLELQGNYRARIQNDYRAKIQNIYRAKIQNNYRAKTAILAWCNRPYWKRIWIIQEIFLAKRLVFMCGSKSIAESALVTCRCVIFHSKYQSPSGLVPDNISEYWDLLMESATYRRLWGEPLMKTRSKTLLDWLYVCATSQIMATDPRDYIYAVLSMSKETRTGLVQIIPDYTKSVKTVFEETSTVMDVKDRDLRCASCNKVTDGYLDKTEIINGWLKETLGLDVRVGWYYKWQYKYCKYCHPR